MLSSVTPNGSLGEINLNCRENLLSAVQLSDEVMIFDNSQESPKAMLYIENQQVMQISDKLPVWCEKLLDELLVNGFEPA